jgi:hypothetical protein
MPLFYAFSFSQRYDRKPLIFSVLYNYLLPKLLFADCFLINSSSFKYYRTIYFYLDFFFLFSFDSYSILISLIFQAHGKLHHKDVVSDKLFQYLHIDLPEL